MDHNIFLRIATKSLGQEFLQQLRMTHIRAEYVREIPI